MTLLTAAVAACVGTEITYTAPEPLGAAAIRYFATAIGSDPARWLDRAPPTMVCETAQLTGRHEPDADGYLGHTWDLPLPVPCTMVRGGNDYRFGRPARPDDVVTTTWRLVSITERTAGDGTPMLVVTAEADHRAGADWLATDTETLLFRPTDPA